MSGLAVTETSDIELQFNRAPPRIRLVSDTERQPGYEHAKFIDCYKVRVLYQDLSIVQRQRDCIPGAHRCPKERYDEQKSRW